MKILGHSPTMTSILPVRKKHTTETCNYIMLTFKFSISTFNIFY